MKTQMHLPKTAENKGVPGNSSKAASLSNNLSAKNKAEQLKANNNFKNQLENLIKKGRDSEQGVTQTKNKEQSQQKNDLVDQKLTEKNPMETKVSEHPKLLKALGSLQSKLSNVSEKDFAKMEDQTKKKSLRVRKLPYKAESALNAQSSMNLNKAPIAKKQMSQAYVTQANDQKMIKAKSEKKTLSDEKDMKNNVTDSGSLSAKEFSLGLGAARSQQMNNVVNISAAKPVIDMSQIDSSNQEAIIDQVKNYIIQSSVAAGKEVSLTVNHDELGHFDIKVAKNQSGDELNLSINTHKSEGKDFFNMNQAELLGSIKNSGIKLGEFQLTSDSQEQSFNQEAQQHLADQKGQNSESRKEKREQLWDMYRERMSA